MIKTLEAAKLADQYKAAQPFPHVCIENFLDKEAARVIAESYPTFETANQLGRAFKAVNEAKKVQVTDYEKFPERVRQLADELAKPEFIARLEAITGIDGLLWDDGFAGGGMHMTASAGHLDVHVDFNYNEDIDLYRRLNLLVYLNEGWSPDWGGAVELWDQEVSQCHVSVLPELGRAVLFTTSDISYHGVTAVTCPAAVARKSFAVYYYTKEPPASYDGVNHSTIFKARPNEYKKKYFSMPLEQLEERVRDKVTSLKSRAKSLLGR